MLHAACCKAQRCGLGQATGFRGLNGSCVAHWCHAARWCRSGGYTIYGYLQNKLDAEHLKHNTPFTSRQRLNGRPVIRERCSLTSEPRLDSRRLRHASERPVTLRRQRCKLRSRGFGHVHRIVSTPALRLSLNNVSANRYHRSALCMLFPGPRRSAPALSQLARISLAVGGLLGGYCVDETTSPLRNGRQWARTGRDAPSTACLVLPSRRRSATPEWPRFSCVVSQHMQSRRGCRP